VLTLQNTSVFNCNFFCANVKCSPLLTIYNVNIEETKPRISDHALEPTRPRDQLAPGVVSQGVKQQRREAGHSPYSSAEVKKGLNIWLLPQTSS
jgi:hypothetical protein